ncbi:MAG: hypothetical protein QMC21_03595 [Flavobacteriales bacterium]|mgnify:CR=1 FL=1|jgi:hypothetical protein|tara:strand:- start:68 stop:760 length:693 start_codon:yes stop_codon:yes gene_type:complete
MNRIVLLVLKKQKLIVLAFSFVLCLWGMFYPNPYKNIIWALIFFPIIRVLLLSFDNGKFQFRNIEYDKEVIHWSIVFPALTLGLRSVLDFKIIDFSNGYLPAIFLILILVVIYLITIKKELISFRKDNAWLNFHAVLLISVFSFSIVASINVMLDHERLKESKVIVLKKQINKVRGTSYSVILNLNKINKNSKQISVSKTRFEQIEIGDTLSILIGEGKYDIPWFILNEK